MSSFEGDPDAAEKFARLTRARATGPAVSGRWSGEGTVRGAVCEGTVREGSSGNSQRNRGHPR